MIAFLDCSIGGINLLCECAKLFNEDFIFLYDNKNYPYANKTKANLLSISKSNIDYLIRKYDITNIILASNTLSFKIYDELNNMYNIPIYKMFLDYKKLGTLKKDVLFLGSKSVIKHNELIKIKLESKKGYSSLYISDFVDYNSKDNNINIVLNKNLKNKKYQNTKTVVLCQNQFKLIKKIIQKNINTKLEFYEYEKDVAKFISTQIESKQSRSFKIELTDYNEYEYIKTKCYMLKCLRKI